MQRETRKTTPQNGDRASAVVEDQNFYDFVSSTDRVEQVHGKSRVGSRASRGSSPSDASPPFPSSLSPPSSISSLSASFRTSLGVELAHPLSTWIRSVTTPSPPPQLAEQHVQATITSSYPAPQGKNYTQEITYWNYIHPDVLASLQTGRQGQGLNHHDEHLFILVHQVFELWFKQILWELDYIRDFLAGALPPSEINPLFRANQRLERADKIMRLATEGYAIMETMDPQDFLEFRDFLSPSSGFQSVQLREMEILLGLKDGDRIHLAGRDYRDAFHANGDDKTPAFDRRLKQLTMKDSLMIWLDKQDLPELESFFHAFMQVRQLHTQAKKSEIEEELEMLEALAKKTTEMKELNYIEHLRSKVNAQRQAHQHHHVDTETFFNDPTLGKARKVALLLWTYQNHALYSERAKLCYGLLQFEQATLLWRIRHARMVELFIGRKMGTGGSSGVEYIDQTANQYRIFLDLWRIRSLGVARDKISTFQPAHSEYHRHLHHEHHGDGHGDGDSKTVPLGVKNRAGLSIDATAEEVGMKDEQIPVNVQAANIIKQAANGGVTVAPHPVSGSTGGGCPFGFS